MATSSYNVHDIAKNISTSITVNSTYFEKHSNFFAFRIGNLVIINCAIKIKATLPSSGSVTVLSGLPLSSEQCMANTVNNASTIKTLFISKAANSSDAVRTWADQGGAVGDTFQGYLIYAIS